MSEANLVCVVESDASGKLPNAKIAFVTASGKPGIEWAIDKTDSGSYQPLAVDLTIGDAAGTDEADDTDFLAPIMGNILGDAPEGSGNYLAGVIGAMSIVAPVSDMPVAGVLGVIMDGSTGADGAVVAHIDGGDDSTATHCNAMFQVSFANDHADSGSNFGLSLKCAANAHISGALAYAPDVAEIQFSNGAILAVGAETTRAAVRAQVGDTCAIGSYYLSSAGKAYLKVTNVPGDTDWQRVTASAAD